MPAADIFMLYADLDYASILAAKRPSIRSRIVLATSLADHAVRIPDIDWVLVSGMVRHQNRDDGLPYTVQYRANESLTKQREGLAGLTKPGCYL